MRDIFDKILIAVIGVILFLAVALTIFAPRSRLAVGSTAHDFTAVMVDDEQKVSLDSYENGNVLLVFFSTTCRACNSALAYLDNNLRRFDDIGVRVLPLANEGGSRDIEILQKHAQKIGLRNLRLALDVENISRRYLVDAIPTFVMVGPQRKVLGVWVGSVSPEELQSVLASSL